jgi:cyclic pyranopterin phosphate synthase
LFATDGLDLRGALRAGATDGELIRLIASKWLTRADRYSEQRDDLRNRPGQPKKIEMYYIGG